MGAAKGAKGEVGAAREAFLDNVRQAMEKQYKALWTSAAQAQESEDLALMELPPEVPIEGKGDGKGAAPVRVREVRPLVLVVGSSVSMGVGASSLHNSWAGQLERALEARNIRLRNEAVSGTETRYTLGRLQALPVRGKHGPSVVIVALSLNNEGLKVKYSQDRCIPPLESRFALRPA